MTSVARLVAPRAYTPEEPLRVLNLGLGVQSTTMLLMAARGEFGVVPDVAIFADTGDEPFAVYEHLRFLQSPNMGLPIPIKVVTRGRLSEDVATSATTWQGLAPEERSDKSAWRKAMRVANPPFFTKGPRISPKRVTLEALPLLGIEEEEVDVQVERNVGEISFGFLGRKCTREYKIEPIVKAVRELLGIPPGKAGPRQVVAEQWIGISTDEIDRMSESSIPFVRHRFPLIEARMNRGDCLGWLRRNEYDEPPKSRCKFCPFQTDVLWLEMKTREPEEFAEACAFDRAIRNGVRGTVHELYLHSSRKPLEEVDFSHAHGGWATEGFRNECSGYCGV